MDSRKLERATALAYAKGTKLSGIVQSRAAILGKPSQNSTALREMALIDRLRASAHKQALLGWLHEEHERHLVHNFLGSMRETMPVWGIPVPPQHDVPRRDNYEAIEHAIKQASEGPEPHNAIVQLDSIWERVEDVSALAEARMRLLLKKVVPPALSSQPDWLREGIEELRRDLKDAGSQYDAAIESTVSLICSVLEAASPTTAQASISASLFRGVEVEWMTERELTWIVWPSRLNWPGVHVRVYARSGDGSKLTANTFHQAFGVISYSLKHLATR